MAIGAASQVPVAARGTSTQAQRGSRLLPFERGTDPRFQLVAQPAVTIGGAPVIQDLPKVGLLSRVKVQFTGTINLTAAGALAALGPWNILQRIQVQTNLGSQNLIDVSGWGGFTYQFANGYNDAPDSQGRPQTALADLYGAGVAAGNNTWTLTWDFPIGLNQWTDRRWGLINLQSPETRVTVRLTPASTGASFVTNFNTLTSGLVSIGYDYYEVPNPAKYELPPKVLHAIIEDQQGVTATGDNLYTVPRQGTILRLIATMINNSVRNSANVSQTSLRYNKTSVPVVEPRWVNELRFFQRYGFNPPTGLFVWDRWNAAGWPGMGPLWDSINSEVLATFESIYSIAAGSTLAAGDTLTVVREFVQRLR